MNPSPTPGVPQLIQVKKYPNRRLYDQTRSRHLTHEELYELVVGGHTVVVTDSRTGQDITNLVLTQAIIEHTPDKFAALPPELLHLMIRAGDQMLRTFSTSWLARLMQAFAPPGSAPASPPSSGPAGGAQMPFNPWAAMGMGWPGAPAPSAADPLAELRTRMEAVMREVADLKAKRHET